jgi:protein TonB
VARVSKARRSRPEKRASASERARAGGTAPRRPWFSRLSRLQWALLISVSLHLAVLTLRFVDPVAFNRLFTDTPLDVILVNARSAEAPDRPQAIAQVTLAGGGEAAAGRARSPLPPTAQVRPGDSAEESRRSVERLQQEQQQLLSQIRREVASLPLPDPRREAGNPQEREQFERRQRLLRQLAEIETRIQEENARPRKRYVSPATREARYALYYDAMRRRIEERGTRDFPEFQGRKLYGELVMNLTVDAAGRLVDTEIIVSSGNRLLDQRALAIARACAPFGPFSASLRREADQLVITSRFRFTREDGLQATVSE